MLRVFLVSSLKGTTDASDRLRCGAVPGGRIGLEGHDSGVFWTVSSKSGSGRLRPPALSFLPGGSPNCRAEGLPHYGYSVLGRGERTLTRMGFAPSATFTILQTSWADSEGITTRVTFCSASTPARTKTFTLGTKTSRTRRVSPPVLKR